jgi:hypothetical protein
MAFLRNRNAPASAPGHVWPEPSTVVEVADHLAHELLHIVGAGFHEVLPGDPDHPGATPEPEAPAQAELEPPAKPAEAKPGPAAKAAKTPVTE